MSFYICSSFQFPMASSVSKNLGEEFAVKKGVKPMDITNKKAWWAVLALGLGLFI